MRTEDIFDIDPFEQETESKPKKKPAKTPKLAKASEQLNMLSACEAIINLLSDSGLSAAALKKAKPYLKYVAENSN